VSVDSARAFLSKRVEEVGDVFKIPGDRRKRDPDIWVKDVSWEQRQQEARERHDDKVRRDVNPDAEQDPLGWAIARDDQREIRRSQGSPGFDGGHRKLVDTSGRESGGPG
jgi:hypothetical protein